MASGIAPTTLSGAGVLRKPRYAAVEAMPLFATPLVVFDVPDAPIGQKIWPSKIT